EVNQPLGIMENRPAIMPAVALGKSVAPFEWIERGLERSIFIFAPHQPGRRVKQVPIVVCPCGESLAFRALTTPLLGPAIDGKIVMPILQRARGIFIDAHIIGIIAQFVVIGHTAPSYGATRPLMLTVF